MTTDPCRVMATFELESLDRIVGRFEPANRYPVVRGILRCSLDAKNIDSFDNPPGIGRGTSMAAQTIRP